MSIKIYHQVGHNANWNIKSYTEDNCGDGLIFSPVHQPIESVERIPDEIKARSVFDPQYYLPNSQKRKLKSYPFFPETIANGFSTLDFPLVAMESAEQCIKFQLEQGFEKIIIPARFIDQMNSDYLEQQEKYVVHPFLNVLKTKDVDAPIYMTLVLTSHMIMDKGFRTNILNWVTSFPDVSGVYLLVSHERASKQIQDEDVLSACMEFMWDLTSVDLALIVGHTNTESLIYSLIDGAILSFGSFENTRIFSIDKFIESDDGRRGPKARIYLPGLFNWVQVNQAKEIMNDLPDLWSNIYIPTTYGDEAISLKTEPHFTNPRLYKHCFINMYAQIQQLSELCLNDRYQLLRQWIKEAITAHEIIENAAIDLDRHGNGDHLQPWLNCINRYYKNHLKE